VKVVHLSLAPVKGMRMTRVDALELGPTGARGDRAFLVVDPDHALQLTVRTPRLLEIVPRWDGETLTLAFPDGSELRAVPEPGAPATTANYEGREISGRLVDGPFAEAISAHLGHPAELLMRDDGERGADDAPVTLMSSASLEALAPELGGAVPDARRFRMTIAIDGVEAWEEHGWSGREIAAGDALLRGIDPVPRCAVTTRDPERGATDAPVLKALATLRGKRDVTFGLWCEVLSPGRVRVGDAVSLA
jgi:MOSC domain-containing protein